MYMCVCACMYVYMPHLFYSSVDGRLGCFHVLAIVNSAAMNIGVHASFQIRVFFYVCPGVALQGYTVALFLVF